MKFQKQAFRHDPANGVYGDCHRTCIATILGVPRDSVPNFGEHINSVELFRRDVDNFLAKKGLCETSTAFDCDLETLMMIMNVQNPHAVWILGGLSPRGFNHSVVCAAGRILHDPFMDEVATPIVGPCTDGFYWVSFIAMRATQLGPGLEQA